MAVTLSFRQLQQALSKGKVSPLYFIFGEDDYLVSKSLLLLRSNVIVEGSEDFNFDSFEFPRDAVGKVKDIVQTFPMLAPQRLVICKGVHTLKDRGWEQLKVLIESPVESCVLVLVAQKVDKRTKYFKLLSRHGVCVELNVPYENQIPSWIDYIVTSEGLQINKEARSLLHQLVGSNLSELRNEIVKVKSYIGDSLSIGEDDVLQVVSQSRIHSIFDLTDAIGRKNIVKALSQLTQILERGESEVAVLSLVLRHFRILNLLRRGQREGIRGQSLSSFVGVPSFFLGQYQQQAPLWGGQQIREVIERLHEVDRGLKSSGVSSQAYLESFIFNSCWA